MSDLVVKLDDREAELSSLRRRAEDLETYSRVDNIIVHGLQEAVAEVVAEANNDIASVPASGAESSATSEKIFLDFCRTKLRIDLHPSDISVAHQLAKPGGSWGPKPMIVRFSNVINFVFHIQTIPDARDMPAAAATNLFRQI
jgi:hypothetical protein